MWAQTLKQLDSLAQPEAKEAAGLIRNELLKQSQALAEQLRAEDEDVPIFVADSGLYSASNSARLSAAGVRWISRVPDTSKEAKAALTVADDTWQQEGDVFWAPAPQAGRLPCARRGPRPPRAAPRPPSRPSP